MKNQSFVSTKFTSMYMLTPVIQYLTSKIQYTDNTSIPSFITSHFLLKEDSTSFKSLATYRLLFLPNFFFSVTDIHTELV